MNTRNSRLSVCVIAVLVLLRTGGGALAQEAGPQDIVNRFHAALLTTMKNAEQLGFKGRYAQLAPHIEQNFHLPLMVQMATGSHWAKATSSEQDGLISAFSRLSIATYASRFNGYGGQSFVTDSEKPGPQKTRLVRTHIVDPAGENVELTYLTRKIKGEWRIIDVLLDTGISELAVRISQYRSILRKGGIPGLISTLNAKADALTAENSS